MNADYRCEVYGPGRNDFRLVLQTRDAAPREPFFGRTRDDRLDGGSTAGKRNALGRVWVGGAGAEPRRDSRVDPVSPLGARTFAAGRVLHAEEGPEAIDLARTWTGTEEELDEEIIRSRRRTAALEATRDRLMKGKGRDQRAPDDPAPSLATSDHRHPLAGRDPHTFGVPRGISAAGYDLMLKAGRKLMQPPTPTQDAPLRASQQVSVSVHPSHQRSVDYAETLRRGRETMRGGR